MNHQVPRGPPPHPPGAMGRGPPGPPPPPTPPGARAGPPQNFQGPPGYGGPPPLPPGGRAGPPQQMQIPLRPQYESSQVVDLNATEKRQLDETACRRLLATYLVFSIRKVVPGVKEKSTWAEAVITEEALSQEDIAVQLKKLKESPQTIADKKAALYPNQQGQVNKLLDRLRTEETDPNFDWSLFQLERREKSSKKVRETVLITVIVKRTVKDDVNAMAIYHLIEMGKKERLAELMRPPMPPPQPQQPPPNPNEQPPHVVGVLRTPSQNGGNRGRSRTRSRSRHWPARYRSDSSSDTGSDSDTASTGASTISSSLATSVSSRSDDRSKRYNSRARRGRSHSRHRPRVHRKKYYTHRSESPEPIFQEIRRNSHPTTPYTGEVAPIATPNAIAQAFQQGREDERAAAQHYLSQRPIMVDDPSRAVVPADRRELEYDNAPPRYPSRQYAEVPMVESPRYVRHLPRHRDPLYNDRHLDNLYEDDEPPLIIRSVRPLPREAGYRRRLSDAETHIARDPIATRIPFTGLRPQIPQVRHRHPFAPRSPSRHRYASSYSSDSTYI